MGFVVSRFLLVFDGFGLARALDFLYMDYRAPRPLEVLITPDILSKYQRMFAFLLRLMRGRSFHLTSHPIFIYRVPPFFPSRKRSWVTLPNDSYGF